MKILGTLEKIETNDDGTLTVEGIASTGARDSAGEIVLPDAMRAAIPSYAGAIREMHNPSAAGKALDIHVDDAGVTHLKALIVDPVAVLKVNQGVYRGWSIGGKVTSRDPKDPKTITGLRLVECSLVDVPCNEECTLFRVDVVDAADVAEAAEKVAEAIAKEGRRHSKADLERLQAAHDKLCEAGAMCRADNCPQDDDEEEDGGDDDVAAAARLAEGEARVAKSLERFETLLADQREAHAAELAKRDQQFASELSTVAGQVATLSEELAKARSEVELVKAQPAPPKAVKSGLAVVEKTSDAAGPGAAPKPDLSPDAVKAYLASLSDEDRQLLIMKAALSRPVPLAVG